MTPDKQNAWFQKLDEECPYQVVLPRRQLTDDSSIMDFLLSSYVGKFDMYVEDQCHECAAKSVRRGSSSAFSNRFFLAPDASGSLTAATS